MLKKNLISIFGSFVLGLSMSGNLDYKPNSCFAEESNSVYAIENPEKVKTKLPSKSLTELLGDSLRNPKKLSEFCREIEDNEKTVDNLLHIYSDSETYFKGDKTFQEWDIRELSEKTKKAYEDFVIKIDFKKDPHDYDKIDKGNKILLYVFEEKELVNKMGIGFRRMLGIETSPTVLKEREKFLKELEKGKDKKDIPYGAIYSNPDNFFKENKHFQEWDIRNLPEEKRRLYEVDLYNKVMNSDFPKETKRFYENTLMNIDFKKDPYEYDKIDKGNKIFLYSTELLSKLNFKFKIRHTPPPRKFFRN